MNFEPNLYYWLAAINLKSVSLISMRRALENFPDIKQLFHATTLELQIAGFNNKAIQSIRSAEISSQEKTLQWCKQENCQIITLQDSAYPALLKEISDPPLVLFIQGNINTLSQPQIAMVGTRNPTHNGRDNAHHFARALTQAGLVITSGLATGIDGASHHGALKEGKPTIAVLGSGLAHIYPVIHQQLARQISENGALVTEFSPWMEPKSFNFPRRNRIISGLSLGVFVIEATLKSGSLITARYAAEQGRDVFAIPGSIHNPQARGCHQLIRQGAKLVETAADIIEEISALHHASSWVDLKADPRKPSTKPTNLDKKHLDLLNFIGYEVTTMDTLITRSGLTVSQVSSMLLSLELQSYVNLTPGGYVRTSANSR
jgi:DNA processing protein